MALIAEEGFDPEFGARPCGAPSSAGWITCSRAWSSKVRSNAATGWLSAPRKALGFEITHGATGEVGKKV